MDVFIKEPLIDWEKLARRLAKEQGSEEQTKTWFPKQKIEIAKRKLMGHNPAFILQSELKASVHSNAFYEKSLETIVLGDKNQNYRAKIDIICPSTFAQVKCLLDMASDPNILGRTYGGWAAWI